jgi:hypothetical protein
MYIESLDLGNIRTFTDSTVRFIHPDMEFRAPSSGITDTNGPLPSPKLSNVNLLLGDNASGKTTVLQAIALAAFGPAARDARLPIKRLIRYSHGGESTTNDDPRDQAFILAHFFAHPQDQLDEDRIESMQELERRGELESMEFAGITDDTWTPIYKSTNTAFFCVAYGATRRVEAAVSPEARVPRQDVYARAQRVQSIFQDGFPLHRLANWLSRLKKESPARYDEVSDFLEKMIGPGHFNFTGTVKDREYVFKRGETSVPFPGLSDGYRGFIGWAGDLLFHLWYGARHGEKLVELAGIAMVDEIDLLLHPKWQMKDIATVAKALPRIQFIFTSHSPLVASSLEWMNISLLKVNRKTNRTIVKRLKQSVHGLDADQVLVSEFFGLKTTRAPGKVTELEELERKARHGDRDAARKIILAMSRGTEEPD